MAIRDGFFDAIETSPGVFDREYTSSEFSVPFDSIIDTGLIQNVEQEMVVTPRDAGASIDVSIGTGTAFLEGRFIVIESAEFLTPVIESVSNINRIDRVVIRLDLTTPVRSVRPALISGTASATPTPPALTRNANVYEISLAQVLIEGGQTFIDATNITDERGDSTLCPYATSRILPTTEQASAITSVNTNFQRLTGNNVQLNLDSADDLLVEDAEHIDLSRTAYDVSGTSTANNIIISTGQDVDYTEHGKVYQFITTLDNTGATNINFDGKGTRDLFKRNADNNAFVELEAGDITGFSVINVVRWFKDSDDFFLLAPRGVGGGLSVIFDEQVETSPADGTVTVSEIEPVVPLYNYIDNGVDNGNWTVTGTGSSANANHIVLLNNAGSDSAALPVPNIRESAKYALAYRVDVTTLPSPTSGFLLNSAGVEAISNQITLTNSTGLHTQVINTKSDITNSNIDFRITNAITDGLGVTFQILGLYEIENDEDANNIQFLLERPFGFIEPPSTIGITATRKNLFDGELELGNIDSSTGEEVVSGSASRSVNFITVDPNTEYTLSSGVSATIREYSDNQSYVKVTTTPTFTTDNQTGLVRIVVGSTNLLEQTQLELGTMASSYEPYEERTITQVLPTDTRHVELPNEVGNTQLGSVVTKRVERFSRTLQASDVQSISPVEDGTINDVIVLGKSVFTDYRYQSTAVGDSFGTSLIVSGLRPGLGDNPNLVSNRLSYRVNPANWVVVIEADSMTLQQAQTFMAGRQVYYELDVPVEASEGQPFRVTLPNGVRDVYDGDTGVLTENVGLVTVQSANVVEVVDNANAAAVAISTASFPNIVGWEQGVQNIFRVGRGFVNELENNPNQWNNVNAVNNSYFTSGTTNRFFFVLPSGTTLSEAQTALAGTPIYYQKTPTTSTPSSIELMTVDSSTVTVGEGGNLIVNRDTAAGDLLVPRINLCACEAPESKIPDVTDFISESTQSFEVAPGVMLGRGNFFSLDSSNRAQDVQYNALPSRIGYSVGGTGSNSVFHDRHILLGGNRVLEIKWAADSFTNIRAILKTISFENTFTNGNDIVARAGSYGSIYISFVIQLNPTTAILYYQDRIDSANRVMRRTIIRYSNDNSDINTLSAIRTDLTDIPNFTVPVHIVRIDDSRFFLLYRNTQDFGLKCRIETLNGDDTISVQQAGTIFPQANAGSFDPLQNNGLPLATKAIKLTDTKFLVLSNSTDFQNKFDSAIVTLDGTSTGFNTGTINSQSGNAVGDFDMIDDNHFIVVARQTPLNQAGVPRLVVGTINFNNDTISYGSYTSFTFNSLRPFVGKIDTRGNTYAMATHSFTPVNTFYSRLFTVDESTYTITLLGTGNESTAYPTLSPGVNSDFSRIKDNLVFLEISPQTPSGQINTLFYEGDYTIDGLTAESGNAGETIDCYVPNPDEQYIDGSSSIGIGKFFTLDSQGRVQNHLYQSTDITQLSNTGSGFNFDYDNISPNRAIKFGITSGATGIFAELVRINTDNTLTSGTQVTITNGIVPDTMVIMSLRNDITIVLYNVQSTFDLRWGIVTYSSNDTNISTISLVRDELITSVGNTWDARMLKLSDTTFMMVYMHQEASLSIRMVASIKTLNSDNSISTTPNIFIDTLNINLDQQYKFDLDLISDNKIAISYPISTTSTRVRTITLDDSVDGFTVDNNPITINTFLPFNVSKARDNVFQILGKAGAITGASTIQIKVFTLSSTNVITNVTTTPITLGRENDILGGRILGNLFLAFYIDNSITAGYGRLYNIKPDNSIEFETTSSQFPALSSPFNGKEIGLIRLGFNVISNSPGGNPQVVRILGGSHVDGLTAQTGGSGSNIDCYVP